MLRGCERLFVFIFLFEYEIGSGGSGGDFNPVGDAGGNVDDVSRVEGDLFPPSMPEPRVSPETAGPLLGRSCNMVPP